MCVCKGRQRHAHLLTREINYMCKFRKCTRSWAQTSRQGEWWSLQCKERRQWRKCCHHLLAALWPSDWAPGPGWQDVKKSKAIAKSFSTDWDVSSQFTCFSHSNSPIQLFSGAVILTTQCASAGSQQRGLRPEQHFHLHKSQGNSGGQWATTQLLVWFLFDLCRNYAHMKANLSVAVKKKKKLNWHKQLICSSPLLHGKWLMSYLLLSLHGPLIRQPKRRQKKEDDCSHIYHFANKQLFFLLLFL